MKYVLLIIFILVTGVFGASKSNVLGVNEFLSFSYCDQPIRYRIDTVDPKFDLSEEDFSADIDEAALIWEEVIDKNLFVYDPEGDLSINLIYDERQSLTNQINQMEDRVRSEKQALNPQMDEYKRLSVDFKQKLADFEKQVEYWSGQGGAPSDEYEKLVKQQQQLQMEADNLNAMAQKLNISSDAYNTQVARLNQTIRTFNNVLEEKPEGGTFKGPENRIEIYFNNSESELVHIIAHELGHALGMGHVSDLKAIMYSKASQKLIPTNEDILILQDVCRKHTYIEVFEERLFLVIAYYQRLLNLASN